MVQIGAATQPAAIIERGTAQVGDANGPLVSCPITVTAPALPPTDWPAVYLAIAVTAGCILAALPSEAHMTALLAWIDAHGNKALSALCVFFMAAASAHLVDPACANVRSLYAHDFATSDHARLAQTLRHLQGQWLLSYDDVPEIRELYTGCSIVVVEARYSLRGNSLEYVRQGRELLISNRILRSPGDR